MCWFPATAPFHYSALSLSLSAVSSTVSWPSVCLQAGAVPSRGNRLLEFDVMQRALPSLSLHPCCRRPTCGRPARSYTAYMPLHILRAIGLRDASTWGPTAFPRRVPPPECRACATLCIFSSLFPETIAVAIAEIEVLIRHGPHQFSIEGHESSLLSHFLHLYGSVRAPAA